MLCYVRCGGGGGLVDCGVWMVCVTFSLASVGLHTSNNVSWAPGLSTAQLERNAHIDGI